MSEAWLRMVQAHANHGVASAGGELIRIHFPRRLERPLPGDLIQADAAGTLTRVHQRANQFGRGDNRGRFRPIAANLDRAVIVIAPEPAPSRDLLHRYITACHVHGVEPIIVVNKSDLPRPGTPVFEHIRGFESLGYDIIETQCRPTARIDNLRDRLDSGVTLFAGQSGVGKSSLLNALIPDLDVQTGRLSHVTGKGTHTTTSATAHRHNEQAWLIDTPGVWEFGLWAMDAETLQRGFPEFSDASARCRFRDCRHRSEPGCAVIEAVESGALPAFRHEAWLRLLAEQERYR